MSNGGFDEKPKIAEKRVGETSLDELKTEVARREAEEKAKCEQRILAIQKQHQKALTKELIDTFFPKHKKQSCSDKNLQNGWGTQDYPNGPECERCALLESLNGQPFENSYVLKLDFDISYGNEE